MKLDNRFMSAAQIRAALLIAGIKLVDIAAEAKVSPTAVSLVISGKSAYKGFKVRQLIAEKLGKSQQAIWGEEPPTPKRKKAIS